eukprot:TRINITY_DN40108_c0_g1_i1.p1 TRINITY_DN40108_c0_g1~~TRINITY_DN40108_c0_g1_i1.p1  ORF type:complete len:270 (+),score=39.31 TRINITY_DN40108_c0_g1_i1:64-873(+)
MHALTHGAYARFLLALVMQRLICFISSSIIGSASHLRSQIPCLQSCTPLSRKLLESHGSDGEHPPLLAVFGHILNASGGERFYGAGGQYALLSGRDTTRAYALGTLSPDAFVEDVSDLPVSKLAAARQFLWDLAAKYECLGVVAGGHFYDVEGRPTPAMQEYAKKLNQQEADDEERASWNRMFPRCNADGRGGFWCRVQGGRPMWTLQPGRDEVERRCACVREDGGVPGPFIAPTFMEFPECWLDEDKYKCSLKATGRRKTLQTRQMEL